MIAKFKFLTGLAVTVAALTVTSPLTDMFGKHYNQNQDFTCCKGNQLVLHHFYNTRVFWVNVNSGYVLEPIGKPTEGCNVSCGD